MMSASRLAARHEAAHDGGGLFKEVGPVEGHVGPVLGALDGCVRRLALFVLDLDEVHPGRLEEFQVFVHRCLAAVEGRVEVQEEGGGGVAWRGSTFDQAEDGVALIHG